MVKQDSTTKWSELPRNNLSCSATAQIMRVKLDNLTKDNGHYAVQNHSTPSISVPIESL